MGIAAYEVLSLGLTGGEAIVAPSETMGGEVGRKIDRNVRNRQVVVVPARSGQDLFTDNSYEKA